METYFEGLIKEFKNLDEVEIIMLGGSKAINKDDELSDYDVYIYFDKYIEVEKRKRILDKYLKYYEIANKFWEEEDDGILKNNKEIEIIYRNVEFLEEQFNNAFKEYNTSFGYSTCMIHNILTSKIIYDKNNKIQEYKTIYNYYPEKLKRNIVLNNSKLLDDQMPSLSYQIKKAIKRNDIVSINHRVTEYLAIYFDILFAINEKFHPGEKRLLSHLESLEIKPINAEKDIEQLLNMNSKNVEEKIMQIDKISKGIDELVRNIYPEYIKSKYKSCKL